MRLCKIYVTELGATYYETPEDYDSYAEAASKAAAELNDQDSSLFLLTAEEKAVAVRVNKIDHVAVEDAAKVEAALREENSA